MATFNFGVNKTSTPTKTKVGSFGSKVGSFGFGVQKSTTSPNAKPIIPIVKTAVLPEYLGGGSYKTSGPGSLILSKRGTDGMETTYSTDKNEIDHKVPVALGGISKKTNLQYLNSPFGKTDTETRQQGKTAIEEKAIQDYKDGKISLPQARLLVMTKNQDIKGLIPKQGTKANLLPAIKETVTDPIKQGVKDTFGFIKSVVKSSIKNKANFGKDFVQGVKEGPKEIKEAGKSLIQSTNRAAISPAIEVVQTLRGKDQVYTPKSKVTKAVFGEEPVKGLFKEQSDTQNALGKTGEKLGLSKGTSALLAGVTAPLLVGGLKAMDLTPFGTGKKATSKVIKEVTLSKNADEIFGIIKPLFKGADDDIKLISKELVKTTDKNIIADLLKNPNKIIQKATLQDTTKGLVPKQSTKLADRPTSPLLSRQEVPTTPLGVSSVDNQLKSSYKPILPPYKDTVKSSFKKVLNRNLNNKALPGLGDEGKTIFNKIKSAELDATFNKSKKPVLDLEDSLLKLSKDNLDNFSKYVEGKSPIPKEAENTVKLWKEIADDIAKEAKNTGLTIKTIDDTGKKISTPFKARENYYPQVINDKALKEQLSAKNYDNFINKFAQENNISAEKARDWLSQDLFNKQYGNLERPRLGRLPDEVLEKDPRKILKDYISSAYDRLSVAKKFGGDDEILSKLYETARKSGKDVDEMKLLTNRLLGREKFNDAMVKVSSGIRAYNNITKLSLSAITNIGDIVKTPVRTDITSTLKGIVQSFTKKGKTFSRRAGVADDLLDNFAKETGIGDKMYKWTGFKASEKKLRQITANSSKNYIDLMAKKLKANPGNSFARRRLEQFNLDPNNILKNGLSEDDYVKGATKAIADLQPFSATDIPHTWKSPTGKLLTQYKTFAYKQGSFIKEFVIDETRKGNLKPLVTFLILGQAVGEGVADLKATIRGREREKDPVARVIDNYMTIGGVGMVSDVFKAIVDDIQGTALLKLFAGPTIGELNDTFFAAKGDLEALKQGKDFVVGKPSEKGERQSKTAKSLIYKVPFAGPYASNKLYPTKEAYKARVPSPTLDEDIVEQIRGSALPEDKDPWKLFK